MSLPRIRITFISNPARQQQDVWHNLELSPSSATHEYVCIDSINMYTHLPRGDQLVGLAQLSIMSSQLPRPALNITTVKSLPVIKVQVSAHHRPWPVVLLGPR